jgi:hypothetical protein
LVHVREPTSDVENGVLGYQKHSSIAHFSALKVPSWTNATVAAKAGAGSVANDGGQCADHGATKTTLPDGVQATTVTISAGEALFVPAGWAHQDSGKCATYRH